LDIMPSAFFSASTSVSILAFILFKNYFMSSF
jgi:hypothetical protein